MKPAICFLICILLSSCHVGRYILWNFADIKDHKKFQSVSLQSSKESFHFFESSVDYQGIDILYKKKLLNFEKGLLESGTRAFLIIRNDSILFEKYFAGYDKSSIIPSFSVAKSFVSAIIGISIDEGYIQSVDDLITKYIPELPSDHYGKITLRHLLDMRSGLNFKESYFSPFGHVAKFYYGTNLKKFSSGLKSKFEPDTEFDYISVNTQLLGWAVENATGKKLSDYMSDKIWKPLGMEYNASWSIDSKKHNNAKAFCCINAVARDFAKFGRLYLNNGIWNGKQLISKKWVDESTDFNCDTYYKYHWWHRPNSLSRDYFAKGLLGQYIYIHPDKNIIIVRLGKQKGAIDWEILFQEISESL